MATTPAAKKGAITVQDILDLNMTGNEFAMGYDDSGCVWNFYWGQRGEGSMLSRNPKFWYEGDVEDALKALYTYLTEGVEVHAN